MLHPVAHISLYGVVAMATRLVLRRKWLWLARILKRMTRYRKKRPGGIQDSEALVDRVAYAREPTGSLEQLLMFFRHLYEDPPDVLVPA